MRDKSFRSVLAKAPAWSVFVGILVLPATSFANSVVISVPPVAIEAHGGLEYQIELDNPDELSSATCTLVTGPADSTVEDDGMVRWDGGPASNLPVAFEVEITTTSGTVLTHAFKILVSEHLRPNQAQVVAAYGFNNIENIWSESADARTSTPDGLAVCPPGSFFRSEAGDSCLGEAGGTAVREWVVIDRNCVESDCIDESRYLQVSLDVGALEPPSGDDSAAPHVAIYVTYDWNLGEPRWYPQGAYVAEVERDLRKALPVNRTGIRAVLFAREYRVSSDVVLSRLELMEADDVHLEAIPTAGPSERSWRLGGSGLGPPVNDPAIGMMVGKRLLAREMQTLGLRSRIRSPAHDGSEVRILARADELVLLDQLTRAATIRIDRSALPVDDLDDSRVQIEADLMQGLRGADGTGFTVAVRDSGIEESHPFFAGRVTERCRSDTNRGNPKCNLQCGDDVNERSPYCEHGNGVTGVVVGQPNVEGNLKGIAAGARVRFFSKQAVQLDEAVTAIKGMVVAGTKVAALNMSYGPKDAFFNATTESARNFDLYDQLWRFGVAPVTSAGNLGDWSCSPVWPSYAQGAGKEESNVVRVSGVNGNDDFHCSSKTSPIVELAAVGQGVRTAKRNGGFHSQNGTSFASPMVASAFAALKSLRPECAPETILDILIQSGVPITETRADNPFTIPRIRMESAAGQLTLSNCPPAPPRNLTVDDVDGNSMALRWDDWSSNEDGFEVEAMKVGTGTHISVSDDGFGPNRGLESRCPVNNAQGTIPELTGLQASSTYCARVRSYRDDDVLGRIYSGWVYERDENGNCIEHRTLPPLVHGEPDFLRVTERDLSRLSLEWSLSSSSPPGAPPMTGSLVMLIGGGETITRTTGPSELSLNHYNLDTNTGYDVYVRLCNSEGCGRTRYRRVYTGPTGANPSTADSDANEPGAPPEAPTELRVVKVNETSVRLTWTEPLDDVHYFELWQRQPPHPGSPVGPGNPLYEWNITHKDAVDPNPSVILPEPLLEQPSVFFDPGYQVRRCVRGGSPAFSRASCSTWSAVVEPEEES